MWGLRRVVSLGVGLWVCLSPTALYSQVLFKPDFSQPSPYGFTSARPITANPPPFGTEVLQGGACNLPYLRETHHVISTQYQYYHGWDKTGLPLPALGSERFFRLHIRIPSDVNMVGNGDGFVTKWHIFGDGLPGETERVISMLTNHVSPQQPQIEIQENIGYGTMPYLDVPKGQWVTVVLGLRMSTANGTANGRYAIWMNNDTYSSPSAVRNNVAVYPAAFQQWSLGYYMQTTLAQGGRFYIDYLNDIEVASSWDAGYHAKLTTCSQTPPPVSGGSEAINSLELLIFAAGVPVTGTPIQTTNFPMAAVVCNLAKVTAPAGSVSNPTKARVDDPGQPTTRDCEIDLAAGGTLTALPVGNYVSAAVFRGATLASPRSAASNPWAKAQPIAPTPTPPPTPTNLRMLP